MKRLLLLFMLLPACSLSQEQDPIVITATPLQPQGSQAVVITATPQDQPTPAPFLTPTLPPSQGLADAQLSLHNENFEQAVVSFQSVLNDPLVEDNLRAAAAYGIGQAALREGLFAQAVEGLSDFIQRYPSDERLPQAFFLRGEAYLGLSDWEAAIDDFEQYLSQRPAIIDSYAYERIGDAQLNLGLTSEALESYRLAVEASRTLAPELALREKLAVGYLNAGLPQQAVGQYDAILTEAQNGPYRASIELQAGLVEVDMGLETRGYARMQAMTQQYPTTSAAYQAMLILLEQGVPFDNWLRAQISFANEDYGDALNALNNYTTEVDVPSAEALLMLGRSYRALGNYPAAYTTFQTILDQYPTDVNFGLAWLEQGRTLFLEGDYPNAISRYLALADGYPQLSESPDAMWRAGFLYSQQGDVNNALATLDRLATTYPGTEWAEESLLLAATVAYNNGRTVEAQEFYIDLANSGSGPARAQAFLWLGRLYQEQGNTELAIQSFQGAAQANPGGYYSIRADDLLNNREPFQPPNNYQFEFDDAQEIAVAEQWLRDTFGIQTTEPLYPLQDQLLADPRMVRGRELWELGAFAEAQDEFESLRESYSNDPLSTYQLAVFFKDIGLYRSSLTAAAVLINDAGVNNFEAPNYLVRLRYPTHYSDLVLPEAEKWDLDPLLIFALIRQESLFESFATSFAAAQGLMQIIPTTGQEIFGRLGWPEDYQNSDVYRPYINVAYGVYYLSFVKDFVDDQPYAALAGYNGGPGNARTWLDISGPDLDLFIQTVTFSETKLYVERIYEQYSIYRNIYGRP